MKLIGNAFHWNTGEPSIFCTGKNASYFLSRHGTNPSPLPSQQISFSTNTPARPKEFDVQKPKGKKK